ncbi:MAG: universal stress protein [Alphaproteobacteria bacterium]|nr:universal stress protein [Alphaproteobacteria bacterium]
MTWKDILVHVDGGKHSPVRVQAAIALARRHNAHLTGLYVYGAPSLPPYIMSQIPTGVVEQMAADADTVAAKIGVEFSAEAEKAGVSCEWRADRGDPTDVLALHARYADVAVIGQPDPDGDDPVPLAEMPERLVLEAGRPVLIVPYAGQFGHIGQRALVAWNANPESTRAVHDALPLLEHADSVTVLAVNPKRSRTGVGGHGEMPGADIAHHLARHGVKAEAAHIIPDDVGIGDMLLSRAADLGADLIVMGGYGRSRLAEVILGGATRHLFQHMTVPVLMSH